MQNSNLSVSVIIPNYNGLALLQHNLPAVLKMMRNDDELIIADDHSQDNSVSWLIENYSLTKTASSDGNYQLFSGQVQFDGKHFTVQVIQNSQNLRFAANCNQAARLATKPLLL